MRDGAIERINAASLGGQIDTVERRAHTEAIEESDIGFAVQEHVFEKHHAPHIRNRHRVPHHPSARTGKRFEEMLAPFAHLADTSGAPPYMGLRVDQD